LLRDATTGLVRLAKPKSLHGMMLATKPTTLAGLQAFLEYVGKWQPQDDGIYADAGDLLTAIRSAAESAKTLAFAAGSRQLATGGP
jgi:hypothetical protein